MAAKKAGAIIAGLRGAAPRSKSLNNLVTDADVRAEEAIAGVIHEAFPNHAVFGEEGRGVKTLAADNLWVVDPLDGTTNFAHGIPHYSVSIAYAERGVVKAGVVFDPLRGEMFGAAHGQGAFLNGAPIMPSKASRLGEAVVVFGFYYDRGDIMRKTLRAVEKLLEHNIRDIRRTGSAALDLCWVACGRFDAYFEYRLSPWDFAAGALIAGEAGARVADAEGRRLTLESRGVIAASPAVYDEFFGVAAWKE